MSVKDLKQYLKKLRKLGCTVVTTRGAHRRVEHPDRPGAFVILASTSSDHRAIANARSSVRRVLGIQS